ncbi:class II aldolase/adducin family protein [Paenibacillus kribbensis]|uniref:class II aldolase/adducin family protein n=1 Tax=Paenibacillus kribbensis TaxID=172713 RepID=UPI002DBE02B3|nr:class II aldolase/adducin family protein [Paenibacillus kribbensis]MEC0236157.1 class II aldolase/adducin family protein [Paenibacillus kribbensis]
MRTIRKLGQEIIDVGQYMMNYGLAWGNSGNVSKRIDDDTMLITGSGTYMGHLDETDLVKVTISSGGYNETGKRPSKEIPMHAAIYQARPDAGFVIHSSPFWTTFAACTNLQIESKLFIESMYYAERIAYVDYYHPGSQELGRAVGEKAKEANVIILKNHGVIVFDSSMQEARMCLETIEMTCRMAAITKMTGLNPAVLSPDTATDFLDHSGYKPRRLW